MASSVASEYPVDEAMGDNVAVTATQQVPCTASLARQGFRAGNEIPEAEAALEADGDGSDVPSWEHLLCAVQEELADLGEDRRQPSLRGDATPRQVAHLKLSRLTS